MLKKNLKIFFAVIMACAFILSGCATNNNNENAPDNQNSNNESGDKIKVLLLVTGVFGDKAFNDSAQAGMNLIKENLGDKCEISVKEMGNDKTKFEPSLVDASESDADVIITGSWDMKEILENTAPLYKDKKYIIFDTDVDYESYDLENVYSMDYKQNEAGFLSGVLAALVTTSSDMQYSNDDKIIGFVGARDTSPVINDSLVGYIEGAHFIDPEIKVEVSYVGSFTDSAKAKEFALSQYAKGVDVLFVAAGPASIGAIEAASESQKYIIGVDSDQALAYEGQKEADYIISSAIKGVDVTVYRAVEMLLENTLPFNSHETLGLAENAVGLAENDIYKTIVPENIRTEVENAKKAILDGNVKVNSAIGMQDSELKEIINSAK